MPQHTLQWFNKTACHAPEALWLLNSPAISAAAGWGLDKLGSEVNPLDADLNTPTRTCPTGNTCGVHLHAVGDGGAVYRGVEGTLRLQSRDSMLLSVGEPLPAPTPLATPDPLGGIHFDLLNNLWNTNYPEFYPFLQGDENSRFRFVLTVGASGDPQRDFGQLRLKYDDDSVALGNSPCRYINASTTDAAIRDWQLPRKGAIIHTAHWVCSSSPLTAANSSELPPLLLFIPGTGLAPQDYTLFPRHAAVSLGLPSISLAYPSNMAATSACMATPDQNCYEGYHEALLEYRGRAFDPKFTWHGSGPDATLAPHDTIAHRLVALLQMLDKTEPAQRWDRFLAANTSLSNGAAAIEWSRVIVAGHSQGACHVGWISKRFLLRRAIMFSGTNDIKGSKRGFPGPSAALYLRKPGLTPASRLYGFGELNGGECTTWRPLWDVLNMSGAFLVDRADGAQPPPTGSTAHMLCSARSPAHGGVHGGPVEDACTPLDQDGQPVYAPVWSYLLDTRASATTLRAAATGPTPPNVSNCDCLHPLPPLPAPPMPPPPRAAGVIYANWSTMSGKCREPKLNGTACRFIGVKRSAADCAAECRGGVATTNCTSWTWHGLQQADWSGQCYAISDGTWAPVAKIGDFCGWVGRSKSLGSVSLSSSAAAKTDDELDGVNTAWVRGRNMVISVSATFEYSVSVHNRTWLSDGQVALQCGGRRYSSTTSSLKLVGTAASAGTHPTLGEYDSFAAQWVGNVKTVVH